MRATALLSLLAVLLTGPASAVEFGAPFPLTNTRYGSGFGVPELVWTGTELYLFWATPTHVRMTRLDGDRRAGVPVFATYTAGAELDGNSTSRNFDVVWTGSHFVLVAAPRPGVLAAQALDRSGRPVGPSLLIATEGASQPAIAFNGEVVLVLYARSPELRSAVLTRAAILISTDTLIASNVTGFGLTRNGAGFGAAVANPNATRLAQFDNTGRLLSSQYAGVGDLAAIAVSPHGWLLTSGTTAVFIDRNGAVGPLLTIDSKADAPAVAWNGAEWVITYGSGDEFNVVTVDERGTRVSSRHPPFPGRALGLTTNFDGRTYIAWWPATGTAPLFGEVPVISGGTELTFKAADQKLLASVSSNASTLVVWSEEANNEVTVHAGARARNGQWTERLLGGATSDVSAIAVTDGNNFLVVTRDLAYRLDPTGAPLSDPIALPFPVDSVAFNGRTYALTGDGNRAITLNSAGTLGRPVTIAGTNTTRPSIASDGSEFFVTWKIGNGRGIGAAWLTSDLQRRDAKDLLLAFDEQGQLGAPGVVWNGKEYVVVWDSRNGVEAATVPRLAGAPSLPFVVEKDMSLRSLRVTADGVIVLSGNAQLQFAATLLDRTKVGTFDFSNRALRGWPRLEVLPDGRLALITSPLIDAAPQNGTTHVMMSIEDAPPPPGALQLKAIADKRDVQLSWSAATSGAVNGYRIEYRIGDGSWNEIAQWFAADQRTAVFRLPRAGARAVFRMRAFGDGGAGAYSNDAPVNATRRRSVR
jgi:hypothetical protein